MCSSLLLSWHYNLCDNLIFPAKIYWRVTSTPTMKHAAMFKAYNPYSEICIAKKNIQRKKMWSIFLYFQATLHELL